jgi:regulator of nonsense transcripts 1
VLLWRPEAAYVYSFLFPAFDTNVHIQVPPYGQDQVPSLKSIFELSHLADLIEFLDTQCAWLASSSPRAKFLPDRMPEAIGAFISRHVYDGRLFSEHAIKTMDCVAFVDVSKGEERQSGLSWKVRPSYPNTTPQN